MTLRRGLNILRVLRSGAGTGVTIAELVEHTGLHRATLHRILVSLIEEGWVERTSAGRRYVPGIEAWHLCRARNAVDEFVALAEPSLDRLQKETGATLFLVKRQGEEGLCVDRREGDIPIRIMVMDVGIRYPLGVAAGTVAILAELPDEERSSILRATAKRLYEFPRLDIDIIMRMVTETRERGYSFSEGYVVPGLHSVGVPILNERRQVIGAFAAVNLGEFLKGEEVQRVASSMKRESARVSERATRSRISQRSDGSENLASTMGVEKEN